MVNLKQNDLVLKFISNNLSQLNHFYIELDNLKAKKAQVLTEIFNFLYKCLFLRNISKNEKHNQLQQNLFKDVTSLLEQYQIPLDLIILLNQHIHSFNDINKFIEISKSPKSFKSFKNFPSSQISEGESQSFLHKKLLELKTNIISNSKNSFFKLELNYLTQIAYLNYCQDNDIFETKKSKIYLETLFNKEEDIFNDFSFYDTFSSLIQEYGCFVDKQFSEEDDKALFLRQFNEVQRDLVKLKDFLKPISKLKEEINRFESKISGYFDIKDEVFNLYKMKYQQDYELFYFYEKILKHKQANKFKLFILLSLKNQGNKVKNFNFNNYIVKNGLYDLFFIKKELLDTLEFSNHMADKLYDKAKEEFVKLHYQHKDSLPLSLISKADKGELFRFKNDFITKDSFVILNKNPNIRTSTISEFLLSKRRTKQVLNPLENEILNFHLKHNLLRLPEFTLHKLSKPEDYSDNPRIIEELEFNIFLKAIDVFYNDVLEKRNSNSLLEKELRVIITEHFGTILKKMDFVVLKIEQEKEHTFVNTLFEVSDSLDNYYNSQNYRADFLSLLGEKLNEKQFKIIYTDNEKVEILNKFYALSVLYNAYVFCYKQGGISNMRLLQLIAKIKSKGFNYLDFYSAEIQKYLVPLNLNFVQNILEKIES